MKKTLLAALTLGACTLLAAMGPMVLAQTVLAQNAAQPAAAPPAVAPALPPAPRTMLTEPISTYGHEVDWLFYLISWITGVMMVLVFGLMIVFLVKYRYREGRKARYIHGNNALEIFWSVATAGILIFVALVQRDAWVKIKEKDVSTLEAPIFPVRVFSEQFVWHFVYPGMDGKFEASELKNVFAVINPVGLKNRDADVYRPALLVPDNVNVVLDLNSLGKYDQDTQKETLPVLHSFFQPELRLKHDIIPFHPQRIWFKVKEGKRGTYEIACAELCGLGHYTMRADMKVLSDDELKAALGYNWRDRPAAFDAK